MPGLVQDPSVFIHTISTSTSPIKSLPTSPDVNSTAGRTTLLLASIETGPSLHVLQSGALA
eukprot:m.224153 g.224153  ORF g.224153 m.224153 type:complete len:61 (-) comp34067_c0_seq1:152-334(-)